MAPTHHPCNISIVSWAQRIGCADHTPAAASSHAGGVCAAAAPCATLPHQQHCATLPHQQSDHVKPTSALWRRPGVRPLLQAGASARPGDAAAAAAGVVEPRCSSSTSWRPLLPRSYSSFWLASCWACHLVRAWRGCAEVCLFAGRRRRHQTQGAQPCSSACRCCWRAVTARSCRVHRIQGGSAAGGAVPARLVAARGRHHHTPVMPQPGVAAAAAAASHSPARGAGGMQRSAHRLLWTRACVRHNAH